MTPPASQAPTAADVPGKARDVDRFLELVGRNQGRRQRQGRLADHPDADLVAAARLGGQQQLRVAPQRSFRPRKDNSLDVTLKIAAGQDDTIVPDAGHQQRVATERRGLPVTRMAEGPRLYNTQQLACPAGGGRRAVGRRGGGLPLAFNVTTAVPVKKLVFRRKPRQRDRASRLPRGWPSAIGRR